MKEEYKLRLDNGELIFSMSSPLDIDGSVRIMSHVETDIGFELVTRDGEMQFYRFDDGPKIRVDIGGRPARVNVSEEFANEFERKVRQTSEF